MESLEELYQQWQAARPRDDNGNLRPRLERTARARFQDVKHCDITWPLAILAPVGQPEQTLEDKQRVVFLLASWHEGVQLPRALFEPLVRAAVYEPDPSYNRWYIEPCLHNFGPRPVIVRLIEYLETGTNTEKAGANNALYWAGGLAVQYARSGAPDAESLDDLRMQLRSLRLREFVSNPDLDVQRSLIPSLKLDPQLYPAELQPLVAEAIAIARSHPDGYIRHRVEIQLGSGGPYQPLPSRGSPVS